MRGFCHRQYSVNGIYIVVHRISASAEDVGEVVRTAADFSLSTRHIISGGITARDKVGVQCIDTAVGEGSAIIYLRAVRTDEGDTARCHCQGTPLKIVLVKRVVVEGLHRHSRTELHIFPVKVVGLAAHIRN